jgi:hypothetical protein
MKPQVGNATRRFAPCRSRSRAPYPVHTLCLAAVGLHFLNTSNILAIRRETLSHADYRQVLATRALRESCINLTLTTCHTSSRGGATDQNEPMRFIKRRGGHLAEAERARHLADNQDRRALLVLLPLRTRHWRQSRRERWRETIVPMTRGVAAHVVHGLSRGSRRLVSTRP